MGVEIPKNINEITDKKGTELFVTLTIAEAEQLIKQWVHQVIESSHNNSEEQKLLTRQEACELLHCSYPTLINYEKRGLLIGQRIGHKVFYSKEDIVNKMNELKHSPDTWR